MFNLYENIKALCKEHGTNVSAMCEAIGISKSTLSNLKNGRSNTLSAKTVAKISEYLDVMPEEVLGNEAVYKEFDLLVRRDESGEDVADELNAARVGVILATNIAADVQQMRKEKPTAQGDGLSRSEMAKYIYENYDDMPQELKAIIENAAVAYKKAKAVQEDG